MSKDSGTHERTVLHAQLQIEPTAYLCISSIRPGGERVRSYRFKLTEEQAIDLSEDMTEELDKNRPLI